VEDTLEPTEKTAPTEGSGAPAEAPKYITEEQLQTTLASRFKSFEQRFEKTLGESLGGLGAKLKDELSAMLAPKPEPPAPEEKKRKDAPAAEHPELKKLQEQIASLTKQAEDARSERDAERAKARDTLLRQRVAEALGVAGIEGIRAKNAIGILVDAEKRVRWSEDGELLTFRNGDREDELAGGLREWLKTEDAKLFLPPRGASGSGDRPGASPPRAPSGGPPSRADVADGLRRALLGQL
jgi:hypothetical protein